VLVAKTFIKSRSTGLCCFLHNHFLPYPIYAEWIRFSRTDGMKLASLVED